jgi:hypothetical protein
MALDEVYVLLIIISALVFGIPPIRWFYRTYIKALLEAASEKVDEYKKQFSERISDAGRKVSAKIRT